MSYLLKVLKLLLTMPNITEEESLAYFLMATVISLIVLFIPWQSFFTILQTNLVLSFIGYTATYLLSVVFLYLLFAWSSY